jgi:hypothetical protein
VKCKNLAELVLDDCRGVTDDSIMRIAENCKNIVSLDISNCIALLAVSAEAFAPATPAAAFRPRSLILLSAENEVQESAFVPLEQSNDDDDDIALDKVEMLGKGSAKAKRGKRKGGAGPAANKSVPVKATLAPEEIFYEGPPAITETIAPTLSIITVIGIVPAAAAWARQAWVRYKITNRRIRVTSGLQGKDMAEIVYPDIIELRTAKRLFGDGDLVAFLRDGAKFEMRNIPEFDDTMEFILKHVDPAVAKTYKEQGDLTLPKKQPDGGPQ